MTSSNSTRRKRVFRCVHVCVRMCILSYCETAELCRFCVYRMVVVVTMATEMGATTACLRVGTETITTAVDQDRALQDSLGKANGDTHHHPLEIIVPLPLTRTLLPIPTPPSRHLLPLPHHTCTPHTHTQCRSPQWGGHTGKITSHKTWFPPGSRTELKWPDRMWGAIDISPTP